jgi:hypothetical protein
MEAGKLAAAQMLIAAGADVNAHDEENIGSTALRRTAFFGSYKAVEFLLKAGADPHIPGWMGLTAIDEAKKRSDDEGRRILSYAEDGHSEVGCLTGSHTTTNLLIGPTVADRLISPVARRHDYRSDGGAPSGLVMGCIPGIKDFNA